MILTKRIIALLLITALTIGLVPIDCSSAKSGYTEDWEHWTQKDSPIGGAMSAGCHIVAEAKLIAEAGVAPSGFNPDVYGLWGWDHGYYGKKKDNKTLAQNVGDHGASKTPQLYAKAQGKTLNYCGKIKFPSYCTRADKVALVWSLLQDGYYVILGCGAHYTYVMHEKSLTEGEPYISDSGSSAFKPSSNQIVSYQTYSNIKDEFTFVHVYSLNKKKLPGRAFVVTSENVKSLTETSARLYGSYVILNGGAATKCGMQIGTSSKVLTELGYDETSSSRNSMNYKTQKYGKTLTPGTKYWYRAYVEYKGVVYFGEKKTFTTKGTMITPEPPMPPITDTPKPPITDSPIPPVTEAPEPPKTSIVVTINTEKAADITWNNATVYGSITVSGAKAKKVGIRIGTNSDNLKVLGADDVNTGKVDFWYNNQKFGYTLVSDTTYYYQAFAILDNGTEYTGEIKSFTTAASSEVTTGAAKNVSATEATLYGSIDVKNGTAEYVGIYLGTSKDNMKILGSDAVKKNKLDMWYSCQKYGITLSPGTTYYYKAFVTVKGSNGNSYLAYGETKTFTTPNK